MASPISKSTAVLVSLISLLLPIISTSNGEVICEEVPQDLCAFAISSSSRRCVLENGDREGDGYCCKTSEVVVERMSDVIETDECVAACGLDRNTVGIASDALLDGTFRRKLCSSACYNHCPNILDLYFNLAAAEGAFLPDLCEAHRNPHRSMVALLSSGAAAAPISAPASFHAPSP